MKSDTQSHFRIAPIDKKDLQALVEHGLYTNYSDAARDTLRKGIRDTMKERGIEHAKKS